MLCTKVDGLLLAGGRSTRFGADKRRAELDGQALVRRAAHKLLMTIDGTLFVAGGASAWRLPLPFASVCIADEPPRCGPLGGIAAGLARARYGLLVLACDVPFVRASTLARVARSGAASGRACAVAGARGWEPLVSYWPREVLHDVRAAISHGALAPHVLLDRLDAVAVGGVPSAELLNVNTPEDFEAARRAIRGR